MVETGKAKREAEAVKNKNKKYHFKIASFFFPFVKYLEYLKQELNEHASRVRKETQTGSLGIFQL